MLVSRCVTWLRGRKGVEGSWTYIPGSTVMTMLGSSTDAELES
jgi:hypothetical protein